MINLYQPYYWLKKEELQFVNVKDFYYRRPFIKSKELRENNASKKYVVINVANVTTDAW